MRGLWPALAFCGLTCGPLAAQTIARAELVEPTTRYAHGVLGDAVEYAALRLKTATGGVLLIRLPETRVFEDVAARVIRLEPGLDAVLVVESDLALGGSVALYDARGEKIAATPFIGQPNRWFAPVGAADFDGDGAAEIAFVDRPHLRKDLVFVRRDGAQLVEVARLSGLTNHRIGDSFISSGIRDCGQGPEVVLPDMDWSGLMAATPHGLHELGPYSPKALKTALDCR